MCLRCAYGVPTEGLGCGRRGQPGLSEKRGTHARIIPGGSGGHMPSCPWTVLGVLPPRTSEAMGGPLEDAVVPDLLFHVALQFASPHRCLKVPELPHHDDLGWSSFHVNVSEPVSDGCTSGDTVHRRKLLGLQPYANALRHVQEICKHQCIVRRYPTCWIKVLCKNCDMAPNQRHPDATHSDFVRSPVFYGQTVWWVTRLLRFGGATAHEYRRSDREYQGDLDPRLSSLFRWPGKSRLVPPTGECVLRI